jgi:NAD(P)-dependent dehydrogenase (short-subunit alcohol dehydrogenase family)
MTAPRKTVLITGAAQGLGWTAAALLSRGDVSSEAFVTELAQRIGREPSRPSGAAAECASMPCAPGWIKTEMDSADQGAGAYTDADIVDRVPLSRFAKPSGRSGRLDANRSGFINGVSLPVDGGWLADASWNSLRPRTRL